MSMFYENLTHTNASTSSQACTMESVMQVMKDFNAKFPPSQRLIRVKANRKTLDKIAEHTKELPVEESPYMPDDFYAIDYADGSTDLCGKGSALRLPAMQPFIGKQPENAGPE